MLTQPSLTDRDEALIEVMRPYADAPYGVWTGQECFTCATAGQTCTCESPDIFEAFEPEYAVRLTDAGECEIVGVRFKVEGLPTIWLEAEKGLNLRFVGSVWFDEEQVFADYPADPIVDHYRRKVEGRTLV